MIKTIPICILAIIILSINNSCRNSEFELYVTPIVNCVNDTTYQCKPIKIENEFRNLFYKLHKISSLTSFVNRKPFIVRLISIYKNDTTEMFIDMEGTIMKDGSYYLIKDEYEVKIRMLHFFDSIQFDCTPIGSCHFENLLGKN